MSPMTNTAALPTSTPAELRAFARASIRNAREIQATDPGLANSYACDAVWARQQARKVRTVTL